MRAQKGSRIEKVSLAITGVGEPADPERNIRVRIARTGKWATLSKNHAELYPGRVVIDFWLARKVMAGSSNEKPMQDLPPAA